MKKERGTSLVIETTATVDKLETMCFFMSLDASESEQQQKRAQSMPHANVQAR